MSRFWSWPFFTSVSFENSLTQARDLLAAERNYLTGIRTSLTVIIASTAIVYQTNVINDGNWEDWVLAGLMLVLSVILPSVSLFNYSSQLDAYHREDAEIHNSSLLLATLLVTAVCTVLVVIREYFRI